MGTFVLAVGSYTSGNGVIDYGTVQIKTVKRELLSSEGNVVQFQQNVTMTTTNINIAYNLPQHTGAGFTLRVYLPLDMTLDSSSIWTSYGTVLTFDTSTSLLTLKLNDTTAQSTTITLTGFKTYPSTKPITYTTELMYQTIVYYYFNSLIAIASPKQPTTLTTVSDSFTVYQLNNIILTLSELQNGDVIVISTNDYATAMTSSGNSSLLCTTTTVVNCNIDGSVTVVGANNADMTLKLTQFAIVIRNSPFVGKSTFVLTVYDSTRLYVKQNGTFLTNVQQTNTISPITYTSTNPYFNEQTILTISFLLTTPGASKVYATLPTSYQYITSKCTRNCNTATFDTGNNRFSASLIGSNITIELTVVNPLDFSESITITSRDSS